MTDCPPRLRGDLSKWLQEINTGVYVGNVNSRVRDAIWNRVCENLKTGRATMVFSTNNEQKMDFRVHNTLWTPVDFEGIQLMRRPLPNSAETEAPLKPGFSKAAKRQMGERRKQAAAKSANTFVVMDLETTGLHPASDTILELGAILVENDHPAATFSRLIKTDAAIPKHISDLTGIDRSLMEQEGLPLPTALAEFLEFIGSRPLVGYNISFDMSFLQAACRGVFHTAPDKPLYRSAHACEKKNIRHLRLQAGHIGRAFFYKHAFAPRPERLSNSAAAL